MERLCKELIGESLSVGKLLWGFCFSINYSTVYSISGPVKADFRDSFRMLPCLMIVHLCFWRLLFKSFSG